MPATVPSMRPVIQPACHLVLAAMRVLGGSSLQMRSRILNYDMKFPAGVEKRPESLLFKTQYLPNPFATVMFKRRKLA